ncbi:ribokinase [Oscillatoriales cyanobacterium LEGE 11467]|uniref:Ribokinase n=1 Tax=Zarconia navalis LEGE 11467 TaxID=1828826 RepID=A0A928W336_9CYAN|nr:ribokinase [Zarconia navalis]MBE9042315.1 ribokinase [Zarconia navalis LEGE 11467]
MSAIVVGSINMDLVTRASRFPQPGETLIGRNFSTVTGGKGANQAVAAARLGIETHLVGRVGADEFGQVLLAGLRGAGVNIDAVEIDKQTHSGVAAIVTNDTGENNIIVVPGANHRVDTSEIDRLASLLPQARVLLLQLEIPLDCVTTALDVACNQGVRVILDPAPVPLNFPRELYRKIDIITPNEVEASQLTGICVECPDSAAKAADRLLQWGVGTAIVKLGHQGAYCATTDVREASPSSESVAAPRSNRFFVPAFSVAAVDTVAAGDAFNGALAAAIARDVSWREALTQAAAAGAIATTQPGAQTALCDRLTLESFLRERQV